MNFFKSLLFIISNKYELNEEPVREVELPLAPPSWLSESDAENKLLEKR